MHLEHALCQGRPSGDPDQGLVLQVREGLHQEAGPGALHPGQVCLVLPVRGGHHREAGPGQGVHLAAVLTELEDLGLALDLQVELGLAQPLSAAVGRGHARRIRIFSR